MPCLVSFFRGKDPHSVCLFSSRTHCLRDIPTTTFWHQEFPFVRQMSGAQPQGAHQIHKLKSTDAPVGLGSYSESKVLNSFSQWVSSPCIWIFLGFHLIPRNTSSALGTGGQQWRDAALWRWEWHTMILAMQSSVESAVSQFTFPLLLILHSSHFCLSWWLTAHHFTLRHSFFGTVGPRA